ncbi:GNAT family N-acetyltransferase [Rhizobium sp. BG4]|uniref:GNAT family N-acetyltransferase n=1 Tax=Rhizobium sp. BG4 TaxID=2613770 RepID=UPI00193DFE89|nr:GNAT family N-acetyltransferase [Rhizobium sp. BG4]
MGSEADKIALLEEKRMSFTLNRALDKNVSKSEGSGETMHVVSYFEDCGHSPAWPLIPTAVINLDQAGFSFHPYQSPLWNDPCLICHDEEGATKGFLVYRYDQQRCAWFILLAYTLPNYRRLGVHTILFETLVERGKMRGDILSIDSGTHVLNKAAQAAFEAQGRKQVAVHYEYRLRDWLPGKRPVDLPPPEERKNAE